MVFDSDSSHLHPESCIAGGLTGFKSDFIEGSYAEVAERSSNTITGNAIIIEEGIASYFQGRQMRTLHFENPCRSWSI